MNDIPPRCAYSQEVRLAVVMYGGVSLAIYMNGVTQELYHLVRATAPKGDDSGTALFSDAELSPTEKVYRKLGQMIRRGEKVKQEVSPRDAIRTRFVIDILSGTSAGGINAIFLSKALANNRSIGQLTDLWVTQGDIKLLLNDGGSTVQDGKVRIRPGNPPGSLLNSTRMYYYLLKAFDGMDERIETGGHAPVEQSPYVDELDLFVTATDINGVSLPLKLSDKVVYERRHRRDFHFSYRTTAVADEERNDFRPDNNPFLAFTARCTSSFPFAFEPMCLRDIDAVCRQIPYYPESKFGSSRNPWKQFAKDLPAEGDMALPNRFFGDGGYLDNRPFSYAIDVLTKRQADMPVDRKLIYIEPSPEHPERVDDKEGAFRKPDAIENGIAALMKIPRHEPIREDLQRVLELNNSIDRMNRILSGVEDDVALRIEPRQGLKEGCEWSELDLSDMIKQKGAGYGAYHRVKVGGVTDDIADSISLCSGFDSDSDQFLAIQTLVREWRSRTYIPHYKIAQGSRVKEGQFSENRFLFDFDLLYRMRRLNYARRKVDELSGMDSSEVITYQLGPNRFSIPEEETVRFKDELIRLKRELNKAFKVFRSTRRMIRDRSDDSELVQAIKRAKIGDDDLRRILEKPNDSARKKEALRLFEDPDAPERLLAFEDFSKKLKGVIGKASGSASAICKKALEVDDNLVPSTPEEHAKAYLWHYYRYYEDYDMVLLPMLFSHEIGEADTVEIIRISPEDAVAIIDELHDTGRQKLAGVSLGHFGAFLEKAWRVNDILWGRLDGAERIISGMFPAGEHEHLRTQLIRDAHEAIIREDLVEQDRTELCKLLVNAIIRSGTNVQTEKDFLALVQADAGARINPKLEAILRACLNEKQLLDFFKTKYQVNRTPNPNELLQSLSRATRVTGKIIEEIADRYGQKSSVSWAARLGQVFWGLVTVAVPGSMMNLLFRHWLKVLYTFEVILIGASLIFGNQSMKYFGLGVLGFTVAMHVLIEVLEDFMRGRKKFLYGIVFFIVLVLIIFALIGIDRAFGLCFFNEVRV